MVLHALALTIRQELLQLDLDRGEVLDRRRLDNVEDLRGLLLALDRRPSDGRVYALTGLTEMTDRMSLLPLPADAAGSASLNQRESELHLDLPLPEGVSIAFDPVRDTLRAVEPSGRSFRVDPRTGAISEDAALAAPTGGRAPTFSAAAYARSVEGAARAALYLLDAEQAALFVEDPRELGRLEEVGPLGIPVRELSAFRIFSTSEGADRAILVDGNRIYTIDLLNGRAWERADFGSSDLVITDMAPLPA